jgi:hypothetical protein
MTAAMNPELAAFLGGFTAAEGCFTRHETGGTRQRFAFRVGLGATDSAMCDLYRSSLGVGRIVRSPRRKPHYDDEITFSVQSLGELVDVVVPFMDQWLPMSHKREQYLTWRRELLRYWTTSSRSTAR